MKTLLRRVLPSRLWDRPLLRDAASTTLFAVAGRALGLLIPFFIAIWFGASGETDAFFLVYGLVYLVIFVLGDTMGEVLIPFFSETRGREGSAAHYVGKLLVFGGGVTTAIVAVLGLLAWWILPLVVHFPKDQMHLVFVILAEMAPMVLLIFWINVLMASLNAAKDFSLPAFSPAIRSVVTLTIIYIFKNRWGIHSVALGYVMGEMVRLGVLFLRTVAVEGFPLKKGAFLWDPAIIKVSGAALFRSGARVLGTLNTAVDKVMASWLAVGSISVLYYAGRFETVASLLLTAGTMSVVVSYWSERFTKEGLSRLLRDAKKTGIAMGLVSLGVALVYIALSKPVVETVLGKSSMGSETLNLIRWTLICYLVGFPFKLVNITLVKTYIVLQRTRILFVQAGLAVFFNVLFNLILMNVMGVAGLALSTSLVNAFALAFWVWSLWYLKRKSLEYP